MKELKDNKMISKEEAKKRSLPGWNIRCNVCGNYGAKWVNVGKNSRACTRALCPQHEKEFNEMIYRYGEDMKKFIKVQFEQEYNFQSNGGDNMKTGKVMLIIRCVGDIKDCPLKYSTCDQCVKNYAEEGEVYFDEDEGLGYFTIETAKQL